MPTFLVIKKTCINTGRSDDFAFPFAYTLEYWVYGCKFFCLREVAPHYVLFE